MPMPQNAKAIYTFLTGHGFSSNAAAGILGNIYGESGGNPESVGTGGNGLIGWTPPLAGAVTGNPQKDLAFQEQALLRYIAQNGGEASINSHAQSVNSATSYFITQFERPANPSGDLPIREQAAAAVAAAAKSGNWPAGSASNPSSGGGGLISLNPVPFIAQALGIDNFSDMLERGGLILLGAIFVIVGLWKFSSGGSKKKGGVKGVAQSGIQQAKDTHSAEAAAVEDAAVG